MLLVDFSGADELALEGQATEISSTVWRGTLVWFLRRFQRNHPSQAHLPQDRFPGPDLDIKKLNSPGRILKYSGSTSIIGMVGQRKRRPLVIAAGALVWATRLHRRGRQSGETLGRAFNARLPTQPTTPASFVNPLAGSPAPQYADRRRAASTTHRSLSARPPTRVYQTKADSAVGFSPLAMRGSVLQTTPIAQAPCAWRSTTATPPP